MILKPDPIVVTIAFFVAFCLWFGTPNFLAAGKALDNPAWASVEADNSSGRVLLDTGSAWPVGRRYVWMDSNGETRSAVDPWSEPWHGHLWTGVWAALAIAGGSLVTALWREQSAAERSAASEAT